MVNKVNLSNRFPLTIFTLEHADWRKLRHYFEEKQKGGGDELRGKVTKSMKKIE
jgi:hypothetical protein